MTYDASGNLLCRKTYTTSSTVPSETRDYIGNIEYINNVIDQVHHEQGRYKSISAGVFRHEYTIADHLGNTRIVYADINNNGNVEQSEILDENHYYAYGMELPGSFINVSGTNYNYKFNGIERVEGFGMDFAFYRGLDPILGRWYQIDPEAETYINMSPYAGMNNNPGNEVDPLGDTPLHIAAAIIGAGVNVYNNWSKIIKNPYSAISYAVIGAAAGAATLTPGGAALAIKITAFGNIATDAATGNMPNFRSLNDVGNYAVNTATNALDVSGSGKLAKFGQSLLKEIAKETVVQTLSKEIGENTASALLSILPLPTPIASEYFYTRTIGEIVISASKSYAGDFAVASLVSNPLRNAIGGQLGVTHQHHSYPKYLGGDPNQTLTKMPADQHKQMHKDMNDYMYNQRNTDGQHMRPQRGNSGKKIQKNFETHEREKALKGFYKGPGAKYKSAAKDFFKQIRGLR
jgi:RHS repeat-associated protein